MRSRILCAVDRSRESRAAAITATAMAKRLGASLTVVHVAADKPVFPYGDPALRERRRRDALRDGHDLISALMRSAGNERAARRVLLGDTVDQLVKLADADEPTMLVVGNRGRDRVGAAVLGSVSRELVTRAPCPVLVVPPGADAPSPEPLHGAEGSVVCGVDGSGASEVAAKAASGIAHRMGARLILAHYYWTNSSSRARAGSIEPALSRWRAGLQALDDAARAARPGPDPEHSLEPGHAIDELPRLARREGAELLVLGGHGRGRARTLVCGSVTAALATSAPVPVLVVPPDARTPDAGALRRGPRATALPARDASRTG